MLTITACLPQSIGLGANPNRCSNLPPLDTGNFEDLHIAAPLRKIRALALTSMRSAWHYVSSLSMRQVESDRRQYQQQENDLVRPRHRVHASVALEIHAPSCHDEQRYRREQQSEYEDEPTLTVKPYGAPIDCGRQCPAIPFCWKS